MEVNIISAALCKLLKPGKLEPGNYVVKGQITLDVDATITKAAPEEYTPTVALPLKAILAIALRRAGIQRNGIAELIRQAATEALANGDKVNGYLETTETALAQVSGMLAALPKQTRSGKTFVRGTIQIVGINPNEQGSNNQ